MATRDDAGGGKPLSQPAQELEASIKGTVDDLLDTTTSSEPNMTPEAKGMLLGAAAAALMEEDAKLDAEDQRFSVRPLWIWLIVMAIVLLGAAAIAGAMVFLRDDTEGASPPADVQQSQPASPATEPTAIEPTAPEASAGGEAPAAAVSAACVLDASAVVVATDLTETITKEDSTQTGYRGVAEFVNSSNVPIYLNLRRSQNVGDAPVEGWYDYQILLAPGEVHRAELTGQSWTNRDPTWTVYTTYAAYPATDECRFQAGGDETLDELARPVPNPLPVGPGS